MKTYIIKNRSGGPWKLRFKLDTPMVIQAKISSVLRPGATVMVPPEVSKYINEEYLKTSQNRAHIAYRVIEREEMGPPEVTKLVSRKPKKRTTKKKPSVEAKGKKDTPAGDSKEEQ